MTDKYPMALYPPKGEMLIVENERQHMDAIASWDPPAVEPVADAVEIPDEALKQADDNGPVFDPDWNEPETFDDAGIPIKRGPGRPKKIIP
jgi:hypothetical protein